MKEEWDSFKPVTKLQRNMKKVIAKLEKEIEENEGVVETEWKDGWLGKVYE